LKYALSDQWKLLAGRCLDQIIMCCVYGVAKVNRIVLTFKDILHWYRDLPHVRDPSFVPLLQFVYKDIPLAEHNGTMEFGDIINFYNKVFIQPMKAYLLSTMENHAPGHEDVPLTPKPKKEPEQQPTPSPSVSMRSRIMSSPMRVVERSPAADHRILGRVTVSPMSPKARAALSNALGGGSSTPHTQRQLASPSTKLLFAFGESPRGNNPLSARFSPAPPAASSSRFGQPSLSPSLYRTTAGFADIPAASPGRDGKALASMTAALGKGGAAGAGAGPSSGFLSIRRKYADIFPRAEGAAAQARKKLRPPLPPSAADFSPAPVGADKTAF